MRALSFTEKFWDDALDNPKMSFTINDLEVISWVLDIKFEDVLTAARLDKKVHLNEYELVLTRKVLNEIKKDSESPKIATKAKYRDKRKERTMRTAIKKTKGVLDNDIMKDLLES